MVEQMVETETFQRTGRSRTFRLGEAEQVIEEIISNYQLGYTEMSIERVRGQVKFVRFSAVFKIEGE